MKTNKKKSKRKTDLPSSENTEKSVLGAVLKNNRLYYSSFLKLEKKDFYLSSHQIIYEAIKYIFTENNKCDIVSLIDYLKDTDQIDEAGGISYVSNLIEGIPALENIDHYIKTLKGKTAKRNLYYLAQDIITEIDQKDLSPDEIIDNTQVRILELAEGGVGRGFIKVSEINTDFLEELEKKQKGFSLGLKSGFTDIDERTGGLQKQNLIVIAGRPGMGKTALALTMARNIARNGGCVGFFSLEMSKEELYKRLISIESNIPTSKIRDGKLTSEEREKVFEATNKVSDFDIYVDETGGISIMEVNARAKRLKDAKDCDLFIVDYIQLMKAGKYTESRVSEVSLISRGLKEMAKELKVPVIAISQLSRAVERRPGARRPRLSDLRESGAIEQDADLVAFVYRPEVYFPDEQDYEGIAEIIFAKHRNGTVGSEILTFVGQCTKFASCPHPNKEELRAELIGLGEI